MAPHDSTSSHVHEGVEVFESTRNGPPSFPKGPSVHEHEHAEPTESSPFLPTRPPLARNHSVLNSIPQVHTPAAIISLIMLAVVLASCGDQLEDSPQTRIYESVVCYFHFENNDPSKLSLSRNQVGPGALGGVQEMWCKADAIQSELAELRGYQKFFDGFPSLLLAIPFGWAADRYGRKPIIMLALIAAPLNSGWCALVTWFWQAFDIRFTWLSALTGMLGGGNAVVASLVFTMLADVVPQAGRAAVFFRLGAANLLASLVMPPIAAWLMNYNPWIPVFLGIFLQILAFCLFIMVPETLNYSTSTSHPPTPSPEPLEGPAIPQAPLKSPWSTLSQHLTNARSALSFLTTDPRIPLLILPFFVHMLIADGVTSILLQYSSKRYHLTFSGATLLLTARSGALVLLFFLVLPYLSNLTMRRYNLSSQAKDLYLARFSAALMMVGWAGTGASSDVWAFAASMAVASFGTGAMFLIRSFMASLVPQGQVARLYTFVSLSSGSWKWRRWS